MNRKELDLWWKTNKAKVGLVVVGVSGVVGLTGCSESGEVNADMILAGLVAVGVVVGGLWIAKGGNSRSPGRAHMFSSPHFNAERSTPEEEERLRREYLADRRERSKNRKPSDEEKKQNVVGGDGESIDMGAVADFIVGMVGGRANTGGANANEYTQNGKAKANRGGVPPRIGGGKQEPQGGRGGEPRSPQGGENRGVIEDLALLGFEGVSLNAVSEEALKKSYWKLAKKYHSDQRGGNDEPMKRLNLAYERLRRKKAGGK